MQTPPLAKVHEPDSAMAECQQASGQVARGFASVDEDAGVEEPVNYHPTTESDVREGDNGLVDAEQTAVSNCESKAANADDMTEA